MTLYENFLELDIDKSLIGLEKGNENGGYFCTPLGAKVIGWECEGIHYCFIEGFEEMVFAVNPESAGDKFVYPLAKNFSDFMRLILSCGGTTAAEQIFGWSKEQFLAFLENEEKEFSEKRKPVLEKIRRELKIEPLENPFEYVKKLQADFDYGKINFSGEYYDVLGLEPPEGTELPEHEPMEFEAVTFVFEKD